MSKFEKLRAAHAAVTNQGDRWKVRQDGAVFDVLDESGAHTTTDTHEKAVFITLAHDMMPDLLEAVKVLRSVSCARWPYDDGLDATLNAAFDVLSRIHSTEYTTDELIGYVKAAIDPDSSLCAQICDRLRTAL